MSIAPASSQAARTARRYAGSAGRTPPSPWTGSSNTAAVVSPTAPRIFSASPNGTKEKPGTSGAKGSR